MLLGWGTHMNQNEKSTRWSRREFLRTPVAAGMLGLGGLSHEQEQIAPAELEDLDAAYRDNIYTRLLGVRPHLGAHEHLTRLGGSRMPPEVMEAMIEANDYFVDMHELTKAAGKRIAEIMGAEAALVTSGAFSAMILGAAACLTGTDPEKIDALPHPTWPRRDCLIQTAHRFEYDRAYRAAGMSIVEAETREEFDDKINDRTAMIAVLTAVEKQREFGPPLPRSLAHPHGPEIMMPEEFIAIGKRTGVPVLIDMASDLPPAANLTRFIDAGADLVVISGGKGIRGPQSTGILAGRRDLIEAARLHAAPNGNLGRGMKVGKEEIIGLVVALNRWIALDHAKVEESWNTKARWLADQLQGIPGLTATYAINTVGYADVHIQWDEEIIPLTPDEAKEKLMDGEPRVAYDGVTVRTRCLRDGEEMLVARRLREFFESEARRIRRAP